MLAIDRKKGYLVFSRCEYLYRSGHMSHNKADKLMGSGDILIPLPAHMVSTEWDSTGRSDGLNLETIVKEIQHRSKSCRKKRKSP